MNRFDFIRYLFEDCHIIQQFCKDATQCSSAICIIKNQNEKNNRTKNNINQSKEIVFSKKSIPVIHQKRQLNKKEPQGMIELHLGGCKQNNQALEVPNELYTE